MSDFVSEKNVLLHQTAASREEVLRIISDYSVELGAADDADAVYAGFIAREEIDQTGMMEGFAIPHCKTAAVKKASAVVFKNETPLEWPSLDGKPVDIAVALLVPDAEAGTTHLHLLSKTAVLLMNDEFKRLVREGDDPKAIADLINAELDKE